VNCQYLIPLSSSLRNAIYTDTKTILLGALSVGQQLICHGGETGV
jgi:hypothetical protein